MEKAESYDLAKGDTDFDPVPGIEDEGKSKIEKLANRPFILFCVYCGLIGYGLFSVVFDWLWARDMFLAESGLVFGPPNTPTLVFMFIIASIGTLSFVLEIVSFTMKVFRGRPLVEEDTAQLLTIFVEEFPSITLSMLLAQCREVPVSFYQMARAVLQILGSFFRAGKCLLHYFRPEKHKFGGCTGMILRTLIFLTSLYCVIAACLVLVFTYFTPPELGARFRPPGTIWEKSYDNGRYFYKAGVYLNQPNFATCNNTIHKTGSNWIKLDSITDFFTVEESSNNQHYIQAYYYFNSTTNIIITGSSSNPDQCFITDTSNPSNCTIMRYDCNRPDLDQTNMEGLYFDFRATAKSKTLVFGDIKVAISQKFNNGTCVQVHIDEWGFITNETTLLGQLQYFQLKDKDNANDTNAFYEDYIGSGYRHYQLSNELVNVTDVWKTGYDLCTMSGSYSPNQGDFDNELCPSFA